MSATRSLSSAASAVIAGYRIGSDAERGPLGLTYPAVHEATDTAVVFRGLSRPEGVDAAAWQGELALLTRLCTAYQAVAHSPNAPPSLAPLHGWGTEPDGLFWIASEAFLGRTLHQILHTEKAKPLPWAVAVMEQVAAGVDFLHRQGGGLTHLDLSSTNVRVAEYSDGRLDVRVINTGLAYKHNPFGTRFTPPERQNGGPGSPAGDVWAAGALLFEILTNRPVFDGLSLEEVARRVRTEPPLFPRPMPEYVQKIIGKLLHKDPQYRYGSVGAAIADLVAQRAPEAVPEAVAVSPAASPLPPEPLSPPPSLFPSAPPAIAPDEFTKLALDPSRKKNTVISPSARRKKWVFWIPDTPAPPPEDLPIPPINHQGPLLEQFTVAQQKQSIIQWRWERLRWDTEESLRSRFGSRRTKATLRTGAAAVALLAAVTGHAAWSLNAYRTVTISGMTGKATLTVGSHTSPLRVGDVIEMPDSGETPVIACPPDTRVMLTVRGARLHLLGGSALELRELSYHNGGPVRRFGLRRGQVIAWVNPRHRAGAVFEIRSGGDVRAVAKGTRFSVAAVTTPATKKAAATSTAVVSTDEGQVRVARGAARASVVSGHQLTVAQHTGGEKSDAPLPKPALLATATQAAFAASRKAMDGMSGDNDANAIGDGWGTLLSLGEEKALMPLAEGTQTLLHLPTFLNDRRAVVLAMGSMQALVTLLQTVDENTPPDEVHLETIAELGMPDADRQRILANFVGGRLESYHRLPGGGYEFLARAKDEEGTLIRGRNGTVSVVGNDDTE